MRSPTAPEILFFAGGFAPVGGIETFTSALISSLYRAGDSVGLVCWGRRHDLVRMLEAEGVPLWRQAWSWGCRWHWPDKLLLRTYLPLVRSAHCIVFGKPLTSQIHSVIARAKAAKARCILIMPYRPAELWPLRPPSDLLRQFDQIVVPAQSFRQDLLDLGYEGHISVLPYLPPAPANPALPFPEAPPRIGFLGRLAAQKNLPYLIEAFGLLAARCPAQLHLFGDGNQASALARRTRALHLSDRVFFHGTLPRSAIASAIDSCHFFAFSSTTEGQCLAALEILARGRPIVATPVGAFPEILSRPQLGLLAPADAPKAYSEALLAMIESISTSTPEQIVARYVAQYPQPQILAAYRRLFAD